jgi:Alw26I/Eco31I/Esp3I family type II restriction endonuclease
MESIVKHDHFEGLPVKYKNDGSIRWVETGNSDIGKRRTEWWNQKREELGLPKGHEWISKVARANHPTGMKPCQTCGRILKIHYVYPNKVTTKQINKTFDLSSPFEYEDLLEISEVIDTLLALFDYDLVFKLLAKIFKIPTNINKSRKSYLTYILEEKKTKLSPGAMSNCPDRFDGFHTYNLCCRAKEDTGRFPDNLSRYGEDRRAYELWSDGDWKASGSLMQIIKAIGDQECPICGNIRPMSADHIGPISLGFSVGDPPILRPMCGPCNSSRNNRMILSDISYILGMESTGIEVASWHTKYVWDILKELPSNDNEAKLVSKLMRRNIHYVLSMLGFIAEAGFEDYLTKTFLKPKYAFYESFDFEGFDSVTGKYDDVIKTRGTKKQYQNNAKRYVRIAFESLEEYLSKENRKIPSYRFADVNSIADNIIKYLNEDDSKQARQAIDDALVVFANWAKEEYVEEAGSK